MEKLVIIKNASELPQLIDYLSDKDFVAFDTETNGVDKDSEIIGFSVAAELDVGYYVITKAYNVQTKNLDTLIPDKEALPVIQALAGKQLVMHNAIFDCFMVQNNYGVQLMPSVHTDTMILGHVLNENRSNGLKERAVELWGENSAAEQVAMKESVHLNGGQLTKTNYELYKADADLIAHYGAKDAILTLKLFYTDVPTLYEEGLEKFFYEEESMPLLRRTTYDLNTVGLKVDPEALSYLRAQLEAECIELAAFIKREVNEFVKVKYPGTGKTNHFNIGSNNQLAWLLFERLGNEFNTLTKAGKDLCKIMDIKIPYTKSAKADFIYMMKSRNGEVIRESYVDSKGKKKAAVKIKDFWTYCAAGKDTLNKFSKKYVWVNKLLQMKKSEKLLSTYVLGIQSKTRYNVIRPSFLQHGTTSGRYSSKKPNFQNLPREDKRIKACILSRPGKVFVGADYSQLEPRVFASVSGDPRLLDCFNKGEDFYSVIGAEVFNKTGCSMMKDDKNSFAALFPEERQISKTFALAAVYGAGAFRLGKALDIDTEEAEELLKSYFTKFKGVSDMVKLSHEQVMTEGRVENLYGRPRRLPEATKIKKLFGNSAVDRLPADFRHVLNLSVNHRIQSTGASIVNRACVAFYEAVDKAGITGCNVALQVHDEIIVECKTEDAQAVKALLQHAMEHTVTLPGVKLIAEPKIANNLAGLK